MHDATRFELFGKLGVVNHLVTVIELDAQAGEAGLDRLNIVVAAHCLNDGGNKVADHGLGSLFGLIVGLFLATRSLKVLLKNDELEDEVVHHEVDGADEQDNLPVGALGCTHNAVKDQRQERAAEGRGTGHVELQDIGQRIGKTSHESVEHVEDGRDKQEGILERLGNSGEDARHHDGNHKRCGLLLVFGKRRLVEGECSSGQAEHGEDNLAVHDKTADLDVKRRAGRAQDRVVDIDSALNSLAVDGLDATERREEERQIDKVMQAKRQEHALAGAVDKCTKGTRSLDELGQRTESVLNKRENKGHDQCEDAA